MRWRILFLSVSLLLLINPVWAHKASDSYLVLDVKSQQLTGQWDIALRDIDFAIGLDADGNGEITWGELRARHTDIAAWALSALTLDRGGACVLQVTRHQVDEHTDGAYAVLKLRGSCPSDEGELGVNYRLLFDQDALHRGLLRLDLGGITHSAIMAPDNARQRFSADKPSLVAQFGQFFVQGVWHIWIGFDHILFLISLLLPVVLVREARRWRGVGRFGEALREVLWVVTSFTVAHSITLSLAALGLVSLPSRLVESAIALSVVLAALNNLKPVVNERRWLIAFVFGLIHGFGFASVLGDLGLPQETLVLSLVGFNVGVEIGQLAIVAAFLPAAFWLRNTGFYRQGIFVGGSLLTLLIALVWLAERALDLKLMGA
ncbi:MAG: HupE/UreJ family protein [Polaromonas sp.]|uniref:HupE/UreJ family protein n=1 Tax=Polaromonas sp. TaxID=1869339 RepID=UPI00273339C3|nr:HupE/UreJ family protein [Polaromonas sp.]MDP2816733.1 HupE/UreJ family protein [Polaromonas sp.]